MGDDDSGLVFKRPRRADGMSIVLEGTWPSQEAARPGPRWKAAMGI